MANFFARISRRLALYAGRIRYETLRPTLSRNDVLERLADAADIATGDANFYGAVVARNRAMFTGGLRDKARAADPHRAGGDPGPAPSGCADTDWHVEPVFNVAWPRTYVAALSDNRDGSDMVLLFHKNKMMFLLDFADYFAATGDTQAARAWVDCVDSWCRQNPFLVGMNWRSPMEMGTRLVAWSLSLHEMGEAIALDEDEASRLVDAVIRQAEYLAGHFAFRSLPNNHLIGEAATLYAAAAMWPVLSHANAWRVEAEEILKREAGRQILADGVQHEGALNYHTYVLDFYLLYLLAKANRDESPDDGILEVVTRMCRAQTRLVSPHGRVPRFGDDSMSEFFALRNADDLESARFDDRVSMAALMKPAYAAALARADWGNKLLEIESPVTVAHHFDASGFSVVRTATSHLVFSAGPEHDDAFNDGHVHSDSGSFELELDGEMVFVDSGTWLYGYDDDARAHLRGVSAHNTVVIDGIDPMTPAGRFEWTSVPRGRTTRFATAGAHAVIACERRLPASGNAEFRHRRMLVTVDGSNWIVVDALDGDDLRSHVAEILFHTAVSASDVGPQGDGVRISTPAGALDLAAHATATVRTQLATQDTDKRCWYSPRYGELRRGTTVIAVLEFTGAVTAATVWGPHGAAAELDEITPGRVSASVPSGAGTCRVEIDLAKITASVDGDRLS